MATLQEVRKEKDETLTAIWRKHGAFFCFSETQFQQAKNPDIPREQYRSVFGGLVAPLDNCEALDADMREAHRVYVEKALATGRYELIKYELDNHEAYYTNSIASTVDALEVYDIPAVEVRAAFHSRELWEKYTEMRLFMKTEGDKA